MLSRNLQKTLDGSRRQDVIVIDGENVVAVAVLAEKSPRRGNPLIFRKVDSNTRVSFMLQFFQNFARLFIPAVPEERQHPRF